MQEINADLKNGNGILPMLSSQLVQQKALAEQLEEKLPSLEKNYPQITNEEKLFLLAMTLNMLVHVHRIHNTKAELHYKDKADSLFENIRHEAILTDEQEAKWCEQMGIVYREIGFYAEAIEFYHQALELEKKGQPEFMTIPGILVTVRTRMITLVELYTLLGHYFMKEDPSPQMAEEHYLTALKITKEALAFFSKECLDQLYFLQAQTMGSLALCGREQKKFTESISWLMNAMQTALKGLVIVDQPANQKQFLKNIVQSAKLLLKILTECKGKENVTETLFKVKQLEGLAKNFSIEQMGQLTQLIGRLNKGVGSAAYKPFWQENDNISIPPQTLNL